jgi:prepilin-type N-terminal cleavage/methylation domain-containing protein
MGCADARGLRRRVDGFSMIEAIVAVALLGIGVAAAMGALGRLVSADTAVQEREQLLRLGYAKLQELRATGDYALAPLDGDYSDSGQARFV